MKKLSFVFLLYLPPICLHTETLGEQLQRMAVINTTVDGHPAIKIPGATMGNDKQFAGFSHSLVWRAGTDANPAYVFHLSATLEGTGLLTISNERVTWQANGKYPAKHQFDLPRSEIRINNAYQNATSAPFSIKVKAGKIKDDYYFEGMDDDKDGDSSIQNFNSRLVAFLYLALTDFPAAEEEFSRLRGEPLPSAAMANFHEQAAAWRNLAVKPELPEETRKQRLLAESYLREKDFKGSIEHYRLGVKACLTWPEGWFNLALLYGDTGNYSAAAASMKNYLELMPDSPDAAAARDKIVIWEDKAAH